MQILGEKLTNDDLLNIKGGITLQEYCLQVAVLMTSNENSEETRAQFEEAWDFHCEGEVGTRHAEIQ